MAFGLQYGLKVGTQLCLYQALHKTEVVVHVTNGDFSGAKAFSSCLCSATVRIYFLNTLVETVKG